MGVIRDAHQGLVACVAALAKPMVRASALVSANECLGSGFLSSWYWRH